MRIGIGQGFIRSLLVETLLMGTLLALAAPACTNRSEPRSQKLGGVTIPGTTLKRGEMVYRQNCARCHGLNGDGQTVAKHSPYPPPDLRLGTYKFHSVPQGALPTDADLTANIRQGFGTQRMPAHSSLATSDITAVVHYIKTFSSRWTEEIPGTPIQIAPDPWKPQQRPDAIKRGERIYHVTARCWTCHPAYSDPSKLKPDANAPGEHAPVPIRADWKTPVPMTTAIGTLIPPDLRRTDLPLGCDMRRQVQSIAAGISISGMPAWHDRLPNKDLWAMGYYLQSLCAESTPKNPENP